MSQRVLKLTRLEEALTRLREEARTLLLEPEEIPLEMSVGRVLAADIMAPQDIPLYDKAAIDGYATSWSFISNASREKPVRLKITEKPEGEGWAIPVLMGSPIPREADVVLRIEHVKIDGEEIVFARETKRWKNIDRRGSYYREGEKVLERGRIIRPQDIAVLSELGHKYVRVRRKPRLTIISIGRELIEDKRRAIYNDYAYVVSSLMESFGAETVKITIIPDDVEKVAETVRKASESADLIITMGRASVGKNDIVASAYRSIPNARPIFHGLTMHPGKPTGAVKLGENGLWLIFPGSLVSAMASTLVVGRQVLSWILGINEPEPALEVEAAGEFSPRPGVSQLFFFRISEDGRAYPLPWGVDNLYVAASAQAYVLLPPGKRVEKGEKIRVKPLTWLHY